MRYFCWLSEHCVCLFFFFSPFISRMCSCFSSDGSIFFVLVYSVGISGLVPAGFFFVWEVNNYLLPHAFATTSMTAYITTSNHATTVWPNDTESWKKPLILCFVRYGFKAIQKYLRQTQNSLSKFSMNSINYLRCSLSSPEN